MTIVISSINILGTCMAKQKWWKASGFREGTDGTPEAAATTGNSRSSGRTRGNFSPNCCSFISTGSQLEEAKWAVDSDLDGGARLHNSRCTLKDADGWHWMLFLHDSSTPGWRKQRVPLHLLPSSRSTVHWSENSMSASHLWGRKNNNSTTTCKFFSGRIIAVHQLLKSFAQFEAELLHEVRECNACVLRFLEEAD